MVWASLPSYPHLHSPLSGPATGTCWAFRRTLAPFCSGLRHAVCSAWIPFPPATLHGHLLPSASCDSQPCAEGLVSVPVMVHCQGHLSGPGLTSRSLREAFPERCLRRSFPLVPAWDPRTFVSSVSPGALTELVPCCALSAG